jgi:hypothetical protein
VRRRCQTHALGLGGSSGTSKIRLSRAWELFHPNPILQALTPKRRPRDLVINHGTVVVLFSKWKCFAEIVIHLRQYRDPSFAKAMADQFRQYQRSQFATSRGLSEYDRIVQLFGHQDNRVGILLERA